MGGHGLDASDPGTCGGLLDVKSSGFTECREWMTVEPSAFQDGVCCTELINLKGRCHLGDLDVDGREM